MITAARARQRVYEISNNDDLMLLLVEEAIGKAVDERKTGILFNGKRNEVVYEALRDAGYEVSTEACDSGSYYTIRW